MHAQITTTEAGRRQECRGNDVTDHHVSFERQHSGTDTNCLFLIVFNLVLQADKNHSRHHWSCSTSALWTEMQICVIMQVVGFKRKEGNTCMKGVKEEEMLRHLPSIVHMLTLPLIHRHAARVHLLLSHRPHDALCIYKPFINLLQNRPVTERLERDTAPSCVQKKHCSTLSCSFWFCGDRNMNKLPWHL